MQNPTQLTCPKCRGAMTSYERSGVVVDQCTECRGIFLDRGELERLLDLSTGAVEPAASPNWSGPSPDRAWRGQQPQARSYEPQSRHDSDDDSDSHRGVRGAHGGHKRRKSSFLKEFLDF